MKRVLYAIKHHVNETDIRWCLFSHHFSGWVISHFSPVFERQALISKEVLEEFLQKDQSYKGYKITITKHGLTEELLP